jgi:polyisoprenoid-binding protein YceI
MGRRRAVAVLAAGLLVAVSGALGAQDGERRSYTVDRGRSTVGFTIAHFGVSEVFGEFREFSGEITYAGSPASLEVTGRVVVSSVDTGIRARDRALMGESYFNEERYPEIRFRTLGVETGTAGPVLVGELRIRSVVREVRLPVSVERVEPEVLEIAIRGAFDRNAFNVRGGFGSAAIGDEVGVRVDLVARGQ